MADDSGPDAPSEESDTAAPGSATDEGETDEESSQIDPRIEECFVCAQTIYLPTELCEAPELLKQMFTMKSWNKLSANVKEKLSKLLPQFPEDDQEEKKRSLNILFSGKEMRFSENPLTKFLTNLKGSQYNPDVVRYRQKIRKENMNHYKLFQQQYFHRLLKQVLISRMRLLEKARQSSSTDAMPLLKSNSTRPLLLQYTFQKRVAKLYKKILKEVREEGGDPYTSSEDEAFPENKDVLHGMTEAELKDVMRSGKHSKTNVRPGQGSGDSHKQSTKQKASAHSGVKRQPVDVTESGGGGGRGGKSARVECEVNWGETDGSIDPDLLEAYVGPQDESSEETEQSDTDSKTYSSFFDLLRDIFDLFADVKLTTAKLQEIIRGWQSDAGNSQLPWFHLHSDWSSTCQSALTFLSRSGGGGEASGTGDPPDNFTPMVVSEKSHNWHWIGRKTGQDDVLAACFQRWLPEVSPGASSSAATAPGEGLSTDSVLESETGEFSMSSGGPGGCRNDIDDAGFRSQERERYSQPHRPYTYTTPCGECVVGPLKGIYTPDVSGKARDHFLLRKDRPSCVTILSIVRDATARLPNGEGTRADVCELVKDSQYINDDATDQQINSAVSGALDRLHYEKDPCVKFVQNRKVWIYLHKTRSPQEFLDLHMRQAEAMQARKAVSNQNKKLKKSAIMKSSEELGQTDAMEADHPSTAASGDGDRVVDDTPEPDPEMTPTRYSPTKSHRDPTMLETLITHTGVRTQESCEDVEVTPPAWHPPQGEQQGPVAVGRIPPLKSTSVGSPGLGPGSKHLSNIRTAPSVKQKGVSIKSVVNQNDPRSPGPVPAPPRVVMNPSQGKAILSTLAPGQQVIRVSSASPRPPVAKPPGGVGVRASGVPPGLSVVGPRVPGVVPLGPGLVPRIPGGTPVRGPITVTARLPGPGGSTIPTVIRIPASAFHAAVGRAGPVRIPVPLSALQGMVRVPGQTITILSPPPTTTQPDNTSTTPSSNPPET